MGVITENLIADLLAIVVAICAIVYTYFYWNYQHWKRLNVPYIKPKMPWGNLVSFFSSNEIAFSTQLKNIYDEFKKRGVKYGGIYFIQTPQFVPMDLDLIKNILIRDFDHFVDRGLEVKNEKDTLQQHLFNSEGLKWRTLRNKLSPTFTSGKMKMMFDTLVICTPFMAEKVEENIGKPLDIKEILCCFTTDVIGSCAFGLDCNSFSENGSPFREYGNKILHSTLTRRLKDIVRVFFPTIGNFLGLKAMPQDVENFFRDIVAKMKNHREENNVKRNDFLQLLLDMKENLTFDDIVAQCFIFFLAGFETSSSTMTFALYYLSKNPEIQEKVRLEMNEILKKHDNQLTYDAINEMKYLGQVIDETLRLYPPLSFLNRNVVKDYKVPGEDLILKKDTKVIFSIFGIHHDKDYYPDPEKFDPDRFSEENKRSRHPCSFLPFGDGPRNCVGLRFGIMQTKVGLTSLLTKFKFSLNSKTEEPLEMDPSNILLSIRTGLWLNAEKI